MLKILLMVSNYFHDLSVALLASNILVVYFLGRFLDHHPIADRILPYVFARLKYITYGALAYIILGGAVRAYFFMDFEWNPAVGRGQVTALIIKHILLVTITIFGVIVHLKYQRKYGYKG